MFLEDPQIDLPYSVDAITREWSYTALLIKVFAYLLALRLQAHRPFSQLTITQIMRNLRRDHNLKDLLTTHFHRAFLTT